jgi:hypothetical protein
MPVSIYFIFILLNLFSVDVLAASNNPPCFLVSNNNNSNELHTIFLRDGWRKRLCRCVECCVCLILIFLIYIYIYIIRNYMMIPI